MNNLTVIVKGSNLCNLACKYCYVEDNSKKGIMSENIVEKIFTEFGKNSDGRTTEIIWHGGEPLMAGIDFFENASYLQYWLNKNKGYKFINSIQTNGTLVTDEVVKFCKDKNFSLGFSIDGPEEVHGLTRIYKNGTNSFKEVYNGFLNAKEANLGNGAIVVLNKLNIDYIDEIYDFFKTKKMGLKINPLIKSGSALKNIDDLGITPSQYGNALKNIFDVYINDTNFSTSLDPLDVIIGNCTDKLPYGSCNFGINCQERFISVSIDGDVYPCGRFDGIDEFKYGNIMEDKLEDILNHKQRIKLQSRLLETVSDCIKCDYGNICNAGCLSNAYMKKGDIFDKDYYCPSYKILFKHINSFVQKELDNAKVK
jgi:uncharacterized protein